MDTMIRRQQVTAVLKPKQTRLDGGDTSLNDIVGLQVSSVCERGGIPSPQHRFICTAGLDELHLRTTAASYAHRRK